jgi:hypothetical protein
LRKLDRAGRAAFLADLRPRFLVVRVRAKGVHFRWAVPSWAVEEVLRFAVRLAPFAPAIVPLLPKRAAEPLARFTASSAGRSRRRWLELLDAFFSEHDRNILILPPGEPLISIETADVAFEVEQIALGARS